MTALRNLRNAPQRLPNRNLNFMRGGLIERRHAGGFQFDRYLPFYCRGDESDAGGAAIASACD
jgi:hypothetical protein